MSRPLVFLSYSHDNEKEVSRLRQELIDGGIDVWWDKEILPGQDWRFELQNAMKRCDAVVLCLSKELQQRSSSGVYAEIREAIDAYRGFAPGNRFLIPIRLSECDIPDFEIDSTLSLNSLQSLDLFPETARDHALERLMSMLRTSEARAAQRDESPLTLFYSYSHEDEALRRELDTHLSLLVRHGTLSSWSDRRITPGAEWAGEIDDRLNSADIILLLVSSDLIASSYCYDVELTRAMQRHELGDARVLPIIIRPTDWEAAPFGKLQVLPRDGKPVTQWANRDEAWANVAKSIRSVCEELRRQTVTLPSPEQKPSGKQRGNIYQLYEVFKKSGVPEITFVEPDEFSEMTLALAQPGRGVVIEGPSGVGKTTALRKAIERVAHPSTVTLLSARNRADMEAIQSLRAKHAGTVVIDDFHRLDSPLQEELTDYLKHLADIECETKKLVVIGIPRSSQPLVRRSYDLATRIDVFRLGRVSNDQVLRMMEQGEQALNVSFDRATEVAFEAAGSLNVAQFLCFYLCHLGKVLRTADTLRPIRCDLDAAVSSVMEIFRTKFGEVVTQFATLGPSNDHTCLAILEEIAFKCDDGILLLPQLKADKGHLAEGIDGFLENSWMDELHSRCPGADRFLFLDKTRRTIIVDDPQLVFYLRKLPFSRLAKEAGKDSFSHSRPSEADETTSTTAGEIGYKYDAFVSYRHDDPDAAFARKLVSDLEECGYRVAIDERDFTANKTFLGEMERCVQESRFTLAVVSPRYFESGNTTEEAVICKVLDMGERQRRLIPLTIVKVPMPTWMYNIVGVDFTATEPLVTPMEKLKQAMGRPL